MTDIEIKVGDKFKSIGGYTYEVTAVGRTMALADIVDYDHYPLNGVKEVSVEFVFLNKYAKIEPFFEVGKTYRDSTDGEHFECRSIIKYRGKDWAFGFVYYKDEPDEFYGTGKDVMSTWKEVSNG